MIVFATCVGYPEKLAAHAAPGLVHSMGAETYTHLTHASNGTDIFAVYAGVLKLAKDMPDVEALVLMHDDLEFQDRELAAKLRAALADPDVAVVGLIGSRGAKGLAWWEGERAGRVTDLAHGLHDYGFEHPEVDSIDGMLIALSPWAIANLKLHGLGYKGFHGYADELCAQARDAGKKAIVVDITAMHHSRGGYAGGMDSFRKAERHFLARRDPWAMLREDSATWDLGEMYGAQRGAPASDTPLVMMVVPSYRESYDIAKRTEPSRAAIIADLNAHGYEAMRLDVEGDSLVQRMRQRAVQVFLKSKATHLLWCDLDIEARDPTCVRQMLESGFDVVAGACPFKGLDGRVVCNLWPRDVEAMKEGDRLALPHGCIEAQDVGTGFCLVSRGALLAMMEAHPELLHWSRSRGDRGEPLWALYDTGVVDGVYQSEDFMFCRLWQQMGGKVYIHVPSTFRHYGTHGFEGSLAEQLGLSADAP